MKEIKIYHSIRKNGTSALFWFCLAVLGLTLILWGRKPVPVSVFFGTALFTFSALFYIFILLKERITHNPYLLITEEGLRLNWGNALDIRYADVEGFFLVRYSYKRNKWKEMIGWKADNSVTLIGIEYKMEMGQRKLSESNYMERAIRKINIKLAGCQDSILAEGLTAKPEEICNILNNRLALYKTKKGII